jgi:hypothetical protein
VRIGFGIGVAKAPMEGDAKGQRPVRKKKKRKRE